MHYSALGDRAVLITLGESIDEATHRRVRAATARIDAEPPAGFVDRVPAFASLVVHYEPLLVNADSSSPHDAFVAALQHLLTDIRDDDLPPARVVDIPVCYGGEFGPDIDDVARTHDIDAQAVIDLHVAGDYLVYMVGFMPGFAYLGGLSSRLATPRRQTPRTAVPAGTVGIGGEQTGVYPFVSPGGWNLIGRTPLRIFDIGREEPALLATGDRVRFYPITRDEFRAWAV